MKKILIFAGTTEGKRLAECLNKAKIPCDISVATEYGSQVLEEMEHVRILEGRLNIAQMKDLYKQNDYAAIVDATHPYATIVTENIIESLEDSEISYLRLARDLKCEETTGVRYFDSIDACKEALLSTRGNILLTTGSKDLSAFCEEDAIKSRLVVRVLPGMESLKLCYENGLEGKQLIAMQGPFCEEMNLAQIHQYDVACLVTKDSGTIGGFDAKQRAAEKAKIPCFVIRKPVAHKVEELTFGQVCKELERITNREIPWEPELQIQLAGIGMGNAETMTEEVQWSVREADIVFGAKRMLASIRTKAECYPYYLWKDIEAVIKQKMQNATEDVKAVVLFSGDSGFYSGCESVYRAAKSLTNAKINILPGISSISYFAAKLGMGWQDARIMSLHGVEEEVWMPQLKAVMEQERKIFFLTSGKEDCNKVCRMMWEGQHTLIFGYNLSYEDERIIEVKAGEQLEEDGLYVGMLLNAHPKKAILSPHLRDEEMLRDKVPMTKEEIRHLSVCKLQLTEESVVYDIGSGTGSIAVEMAMLSPRINVYAVETNSDAVSLIKKNCDKFQATNVSVVEALAPEGLEDLPSPSHVFIGGSKGNLKEILVALQKKAKGIRVVMNAVSMESVCQMQTLLNELNVEDVDVVQVAISKTKQLGEYHMLQANNPVFIFSFTLM